MPKDKRKPTTKTSITPRERILADKRVASLLAGDNKPLRQLAIEAGYSGANAHTATQGASQVLRKPHVREYVQERVYAATDANNQEVLALLTTHLRADIGDFPKEAFNEDGSLNIPELKRKGLSRVIKEYETETTITEQGNKSVKVKLKLHDSHAAAKALIPVFKMIAPPTITNVNVNLKVTPEDAQWAREMLERLRNDGMTDEEIALRAPTVIEIAAASV